MSKYRVFAFSEQSIKQYSGSAKPSKLDVKMYPQFDTIVMYFEGSNFILCFIENGKLKANLTFYFGYYPEIEVNIELAGTTQPEVKEEITFCVGDKVFDWKYGWMIINEIESHGSIVLVDANHKEHTFSNGESLRLSFTEYNFVTGGWSQERPKPLPKVGDIGWFWDDKMDIIKKCCSYGELSKIIEESSKYVLNGARYSFFSTENPF